MLKSAGCYQFDEFLLDADDRRLMRDGVPVDISSRYLDALALMVREHGKLISKDRFLDEVWSGVPVTDEALTQCIRTLRRALGDDASRPRLIETVPKHGYRFIGAVGEHAPREGAGTPSAGRLPDAVVTAGAGIIGGGMAGFTGGVFYGLIGASQPQLGTGALSVLLVILCLCILVALIGAAGVSIGIALAQLIGRGRTGWLVVGGALGGAFIGALAKLLGLDAFTLLVGRSPTGITGAMEGALIGLAVGIGAWLAARGRGLPRLRRSAATAGLVGAVAGLVVPLLGGRLMLGSLDLLASEFPRSRLRLGHVGALFGEDGFGRLTQLVSGALEGGLFAAFVVGAMILAQRRRT